MNIKRQPYINFGVIRQSREGLVQGLVHLLRISFEESATS